MKILNIHLSAWVRMASPRTRRVLKEVRTQDENNVSLYSNLIMWLGFTS